MDLADIITATIAIVVMPQRFGVIHLPTRLGPCIVWFRRFPSCEGGCGTILPVPICSYKVGQELMPKSAKYNFRSYQRILLLWIMHIGIDTYKFLESFDDKIKV